MVGVDAADAERERRHFAWMSAPDIAATINLASVRTYERWGRGIWFASAIVDNGPPKSVTYVTLTQLMEQEALFPDLIPVVESYIPTCQAIAVIEDLDDRATYYILQTTMPEAN